MSQIVTWRNGISQNYDRFELPGEKKNNGIPTKCRSKCLWCIACSALIVSIFIITITTWLTIRSKEDGNHFMNDNLNSSHRGKILFVINDTKVMHLDLETNTLTRELEVPENSAIKAYEPPHNTENHSYWVGKFANATPLVAQKEDTMAVLLQDTRFKPNSLAFDRTSGNIYATDANSGTAAVINIHTGYYTILLTDLIDARQVVLDPEEGLMFILQYFNSIVRATMDGSQPTTIVTNQPITSLTLDPINKRLYWVDNFTSIQTSDYNGGKRRSILNHVATVKTLTFTNNHLFWSQPLAENYTSLHSCRVGLNNNCVETMSNEIDVTGNVTSIGSYPELAPLTSHPCHTKNGGCKHLCLPSGKNKSVCACRMGWELDSDGSGCQEVRDFILYPYGDVVRTCSLDGKREIFWPTPYTVKKLDVKTEIDFEYDLKNDYFYFSDDHHIHRMKLKSFNGQEIVLSANSTDTIIEDMAYDWYTGNMYFGRHHVNTSREQFLAVFNTQLGQGYIKTVNVSTEDIKEGEYSYAMALHGTKRFLFTSIIRGRNEWYGMTEILRISINGSDVESIYQDFAPDVYDHRFFTVDEANGLFYKLFKMEENKVFVKWSSVDYPGKMGRSGSLDVIRPRTVAVNGQSLYVSNSSSIHRFDVKTGKDGVKIAPRIEDPTKKVVAVRVISEDVQLTGSNNPCRKENGGCEQFCFAGSKATCDCRDGQKVKSDGHCY